MTRKKTIKEQAAGDTEELRHREDNARLDLQEAQERRAISTHGEAAAHGSDEARDMMLMFFGQVQTSLTVSSFSQAITLTRLKNIKENQLYKRADGLQIPDGQGGVFADVSTWAGFCRALGLSHQKVDEDLRYLNAFGEEMFDNFKRIGLSYRDMRKLRQLPEPEQEAIVNGEAVDVGDKEAVVSLIEDMTAKHVQERERLEKKNQDLSQDLDAARRRHAEKDQKINELHAQLDREANATPDEQAAALSEGLEQATRKALDALLLPNIAIGSIFDWDEAPRELIHACAQAIARLRIGLDEIETRYGIEPVELDVDHSWHSLTDSDGTPSAE